MYETITIKQFDTDKIKNEVTFGKIEIKKNSKKPYACRCNECQIPHRLTPGVYKFYPSWWTKEELHIIISIKDDYSGEYTEHEFEVYVYDEDWDYCKITI